MFKHVAKHQPQQEARPDRSPLRVGAAAAAEERRATVTPNAACYGGAEAGGGRGVDWKSGV